MNALDVFLTGTDVRGRVWDDTDSRGSCIQIKDHRVVFHLKHRAQGETVRKSAFDPKGGLDEEEIVQGLAAIARTTSAFPVAFRPVEYDPSSPAPYVAMMRKTLPDHARDSKAWFTDGGVLDNKPFTQAIETIYYRKANRLVDRKLFYVEPDPERYLATKHDEPLPEAVALASITSIPGYESIADDIARLEQHNRKVRLFKELIEGEKHASDPKIYENAQRAELIDWIEGRLDDLGVPLNPVREQVEDAARQILDIGADSDKALRRCFYTIYRLYERERDERGALTAGQQIEMLFEGVALLRIVNFACEIAIDEVLPDLSQLAPRLAGVLSPVDDEITGDEVKLHRELERRARTASSTFPLARSVVDQIVERTAAKLAGTPAEEMFLAKFEEVDRWLFPLQAASGVESQDEIELVRISPFDTHSDQGYATQWHLAPPQKISGDALFHFGGFIKRAWRSNDVFWGKCDAAEILIDSLIDEQRLATVLDRHDAPDELLKRVIADLNLEEHERPALDAGMPRAELATKLKSALVKSAHRRIAREDVPKVAYDVAVEEGTARFVDRAELRDSVVDEAMSKAAARGRFTEVDQLAKHWISTIGGEDLTQVAPLRLGRVITQTGLLVTRIMRARAESLSIFGKAGGRLVQISETILSALYILARSMEVNAFINALLVTALGTAFGVSLLMLLLTAASTKQFPDGLPLAIVAGSALMFTFAKHALAIRVQPRAFRVRGLFGLTPLATAMIGLIGTAIFGMALSRFDPVVQNVTVLCDLFEYLGRESCGIVSLEVSGDAWVAKSILEAWREDHLTRYAWVSLVLDQPFILFYVMFGVMVVRVSTAMLAMVFRDRPEAVLRSGFIRVWSIVVRMAGLLVAISVVIAGLLDLYENVQLARIIWDWRPEAYPDQVLVDHAFWSATIKFRLLALALLFSSAAILAYAGIRTVLRTKDALSRPA